jgi:Bacterial alpha-L-rhamnosidase 6 hairpin glycosidase domain
MQGVQNILRFGRHTLSSVDSADEPAPYFLAGRKMYYIGMTSGDMQPIGAEHLVGEMGGLWAHPIKVADGITLAIADADGAAPASEDSVLTQSLSHIEWQYRIVGLVARRRDFVAEGEPAFFSLLSLSNPGAQLRTGMLQLTVWLKFLGCWFGGLRCGEAEYWLDDTVVLGYDQLWQGHWGVACGTTAAPARCEFAAREPGQAVTLSYPFAISPGQSASWEFLLAADHQRGHTGARQLFGQLAGSGEQLLAEKIANYQRVAFTGVALETPDPAVDRAFALAKANLQLLSADYGPQLRPFFLAGVPEYPQLFGCDTEYSVPGAVAAGFAEITKSALLALAEYGERACGRIPHEITANGRVFHPGNTQETPQFAAACWDYFRWTGDSAFLRRVYPLCKEGVDEYMPALWSGMGALYPIGDGVVERQGMGSRKLDSTCYLFQALRALRDMAAALGESGDARRYAWRLDELGRRFEEDWWLDDQEMYADSLHTDGTPQLDGHWTVVLPLQLGMAGDERARRVLARIKHEWVNEWGLVHTRAREERVWTLPTGLLALTAFQYDQPDLGLKLLHNIAETASHGTLGAFKELIPIGLCFVQLWSAALYVQGLLEGLLGLSPLAHVDRLAIAPRLPAAWPGVALHNLVLGEHLVDLELTHSGCAITHRRGVSPLDLRYRVPASVAEIECRQEVEGPHQLVDDENGHWIQATLLPGESSQISVAADQQRVYVTHNRSPQRDREEVVQAADPATEP